MKIILLSANKSTQPYPVYPLGLDYVAGSISSKHDIGMLDMNDFENAESLGSAIKDISADVIGISIRNIDNTDASDTRYFIGQYQVLISEIRKNSRALIILGGSGFTIFPSELMSALNADYGIIGEGERFSLFLEALGNKTNPVGVPGVITKNSSAAIPEPWNSKINREFRQSNPYVQYYINKGGMLNLQTKRGCSFRCIYCTYPHIEGSSLRLFPPDEIAATARGLQDAGAKYIFITDSAFNCSYEHSSEVAGAFIKSGLSVPWGAFFAPSNPPEDYYRRLADAGLTHAEFGTESLSNEVLRNYRKPFNVTDVLASHELALKAGLHIAHYLLPGGPGESSETLNETLANADKLAKTIFFIFCGMRIYPHTELYEIAKNEGQVTASENLLEPVFYKSSMMSSEQIMKTVEDHAAGKSNWVIGSGGRKASRLLKRMYKEGYTGPLWEHLIQ